MGSSQGGLAPGPFNNIHKFCTCRPLLISSSEMGMMSTVVKLDVEWQPPLSPPHGRKQEAIESESGRD